MSNDIYKKLEDIKVELDKTGSVTQEGIEWLILVAEEFLEQRKLMGDRDFRGYDMELRDKLYKLNFELGNLKTMYAILEGKNK